MAWCPKCEEEYEDHVKVCATCQVELVGSLEDIPKDRILVVLNSEEEVAKVLEFLEYSKIETAQQHESVADSGETVYVITVNEDEWPNAQRFMQGYALVEKEEPDYEDFYFDKYKTVDLENESQIAEIKSSYLSFIGLGAVILMVGVANLLNLVNFLAGNLAVVFSVMGLIFIVIGVYTKATISKKVDQTDNVKEAFEALYQWYVDTYPVDTFFERHQVEVEDLDEGVRYFTLMDLIIEECKHTTLTDQEEMINTVAEKVYSQLTN